MLDLSTAMADKQERNFVGEDGLAPQKQMRPFYSIEGEQIDLCKNLIFRSIQRTVAADVLISFMICWILLLAINMMIIAKLIYVSLIRYLY